MTADSTPAPSIPSGRLAFFVAPAVTPETNVVRVGTFMALDEVTDFENKFRNAYLIPPNNEVLFLSLSAGTRPRTAVSMAVRESQTNTDLLQLVRADGRQAGVDTVSTSGLGTVAKGQLSVTVASELTINGYRLTSFSGFSITDVMMNPIETFDLRAVSPAQTSGYITWETTNQNYFRIPKAGVYFITLALELDVRSSFDMRLEVCGQEFPLQRIHSAYNTRDSLQIAALVQCTTDGFNNAVRVNSFSQPPAGIFQNVRLFGFLVEPKHTRPIYWHLKQENTASESGSMIGFGQVLLMSATGTVSVEDGSIRVAETGYYLVHLSVSFDPRVALNVEVLSGKGESLSTVFGIIRDVGINGTLDVISRSVVSYMNANDIMRVHLVQGNMFPSSRLAGVLLYLIQ